MYTRKDSLNDHHLSTHDNKRTRSCDTCGKRFNTKRQLNQHEKTHEDKKFICYICDRSFICLKYLSAHNRTKLHIRKIENITADPSLVEAAHILLTLKTILL
jgi:KRAB domain-containing zinc finger protein